MSSIQFGTDGWRAIIDRDFTPLNIEKVIQAFCDWRKKTDPKQNQVVLGYDRRAKSPESAQLAAQVLAANGFKVRLSSQYCPTPCVSWMVKVSEAFAGIMITASHNPSNWNGIKFKEEYGGSASPAYTAEVEKQIELNEKNGRTAEKADFKAALDQGQIEFFNPNEAYLNQLKSLVDVDLIQKSGMRVLVDSLYGAGTNFIKQILGDAVDELHTEADSTFGGLNPEPIDKNLTELLAKMKTGRWQAGLATDGDADRIGASDEKGNFVSSHLIFALLLKHYVEDKKLTGTIVKSLSTTQIISLLCKKYGLNLIETPIGFKHICPNLVRHNALMGGEESGGLSFAPHVHERDGVLNSLMLLEMMAMRKKTLSQLIEELFADVGAFYFDRVDLHVERPQIEAMRASLQSKPIADFGPGRKVVGTNTADGFKYLMEDDSWLLLRASGTEPLVRVYAEARSPEIVKDLLSKGKNLVGS